MTDLLKIEHVGYIPTFPVCSFLVHVHIVDHFNSDDGSAVTV